MSVFVKKFLFSKTKMYKIFDNNFDFLNHSEMYIFSQKAKKKLFHFNTFC